MKNESSVTDLQSPGCSSCFPLFLLPVYLLTARDLRHSACIKAWAHPSSPAPNKCPWTTPLWYIPQCYISHIGNGPQKGALSCSRIGLERRAKIFMISRPYLGLKDASECWHVCPFWNVDSFLGKSDTLRVGTEWGPVYWGSVNCNTKIIVSPKCSNEKFLVLCWNCGKYSISGS